jgi:hypothetical protein
MRIAKVIKLGPEGGNWKSNEINGKNENQN